MITQAIEELKLKKNLSSALMGQAMEEIMSGKVGTQEIVIFLTALKEKGETVEELTAATFVMRTHVTKINTCNRIVLDTCGTGGDAKGTFNISTAAAFVAAGAGITVAKHGNRSFSSKCGSADILEALGINIHLPAEKLKECLEAIGIAFLFAQDLHPAMKHVALARKQIASRTIFNLLGPLSNPAGAAHQIVGVYDKKLLEVLAGVLLNLGTTHALVVHGQDGLDEITTTSSTFIAEVKNDAIKTYEIKPQSFGITCVDMSELKGGDADFNAKILVDVLNAISGPARDIVVLNAAAAIYAADKAASIEEGIKLASQAIDSKKALEKLLLLKKFSNSSF